MNISDRIQSLRKSKGISQEELADKIGVSRQAVSKWESEQSSPDIEKVLLLSDYFDVTTDYLLKGIEPIAETQKTSADARIFSVTGTALNFIGLVSAVTMWMAEQTVFPIAIGLIIPAIGCMCFAIGQFIGSHQKQAAFLFWIINIWILFFIPFWGVFYRISGFCWIIYFAVCIIFDAVMLKKR